MTKYLRKLIVFIIGITLAITASFFMEIAFYKEFIFFLIAVMVGFFAGNGIEHLSNGIKKNNGGNENDA
ncbi:unnamed protein product [marine sediment metagenome]|uniref:Uncharacterized protein n=1 Tax=marine sediment metagenome TaxID=412755 RepID=X0VFQ3_9ZZZZ